MKWPGEFAQSVKERSELSRKDCYLRGIVVAVTVLLILFWWMLNGKMNEMTATELKEANRFESEIWDKTDYQLWRKQWDDCLVMPQDLEMLLDRVDEMREDYNKIKIFKERN